MTTNACNSRSQVHHSLQVSEFLGDEATLDWALLGIASLLERVDPDAPVTAIVYGPGDNMNHSTRASSKPANVVAVRSCA
jgi:hypothetical protein